MMAPEQVVMVCWRKNAMVVYWRQRVVVRIGGDYDGVGKYTLVSFDFPKEFAGISFGIGLSDFDAADGGADEDGFVITFSM